MTRQSEIKKRIIGVYINRYIVPQVRKYALQRLQEKYGMELGVDCTEGLVVITITLNSYGRV